MIESEKSRIKIWSDKNRMMIDSRTSSSGQAFIEVTNLLGQQIFADKFTTGGLYTKEINTASNGYVLVLVKTPDGDVVAAKIFISNAE